MSKWFRRKREEESSRPEAGGEAEAQQTDRTGTETEEPEVENSRQVDPDHSSGFFLYMRQRLSKTRQSLSGRIDRLMLGKKEIDEDALEELEEVLITSDLGVDTTRKLMAALEDKLHRRELADADRLRLHLKDEIRRLLAVEARSMEVSADKPFVVMAVGVNGVGKTTTLAKLAHHYQRAGLKAMLVAADTFRAAAVDQLARWSERAGADLVKQRSGADPAAVVFDGMDAARARGVDVVLIDTAGRLHTKVNLMEELKKVKRVISRQMPAAPHEILLILDATTGQNAISQVRLFHQELEVSGLVLTKLDGTAKGGIVVGICQETQIPIRFIGLGEGLDDLKEFNVDQFVNALF
ncbi:MAG: signal recognition particle-docking protein FtsY [Deltaproteobacteria bacterium]|nr:MAG: signal recognition particle-docking protein FtsY [Deltaproteobacteria bacterium]